MRKQYKTVSRAESGMTLVELLVAMALSGLVALAAVSILIVARQGFTSVDSSSQLRDNERFATSIMRRIITQSGYLEEKYAIDTASDFLIKSPEEIEPNIKGFNNAKYNQNLATGVSTTVSTTGYNNSDMLVIRYQAGETYINSGISDQTMINCSGSSQSTAITSTERMLSVFHIAVNADTNEPSLMCTWVNDAGTWSTQPLISGVESLQLLYGTDGVTAGAAPTETEDSFPDSYLRADQLTVASNNAATLANWRRVRSIRVGMVIRGPAGSAPEKTVPAQYPLGAEGVMNIAADTGSTFSSQTDGRLRKSITFTIHLRNPQDNV